jgi:hypothetical protein
MALAWKAGWVNALAGSNPASSATLEPRPARVFDGNLVVNGANTHPTRPAPFIRVDIERGSYANARSWLDRQASLRVLNKRPVPARFTPP